MTAPPELPFQLVIHENGTEDGWAYVRVDDYLAAIADAEARGLRMAIEATVAMSRDMLNENNRRVLMNLHARLHALIPDPPPADGGDT